FLFVSDRTFIDKKSKKRLIIFFVTFIIGISIFFFSSEVFSNLFMGSVEKLTNKESSYQGRIVAVLANFNIWIENPLFGSGVNALVESVESGMQSNFSYSTSHNTS